MRSAAEHDLWPMILSGEAVDAGALAAALQREVLHGGELDFRTRLLIRDSADVLERHWGPNRLENWLTSSPAGTTIRQLRSADLGPPGFSLLRHCVMDTTKPDAILSMLRELGAGCARSAIIEIGGAVALILSGVLSRRTMDIDLVDEIPATIRNERQLLDNLASRYRLQLTHFQSHYLPNGWRERLHSLGRFGKLDVFLIDPLDIFVGKLFSARTKDRDDLRVIARHIEKPQIEARLRDAGGSLRADAKLAQHATDNWYIVYGEPLPG